MRKRLAVGVVSAAIAISLTAVSAASAATEFGDACTADNAKGPPLTFTEIFHPQNPLPTAAPISGVLTRWQMNVAPDAPFPIPVTLKVLRLNAGPPPTATVQGEAAGTLVGASNSFGARIPIQAGDRLGSAGGLLGALICESSTAGTITTSINSVSGAPPIGYMESSDKLRVPMVAVIEPDVDGDGYGDETQDGCPQSAAYQTPCPVVTIDAVNLIGRKATTVVVATSLDAPVSVSGTVKLGNGGKVTLKAKGRTVAAGSFARFKLKFNGKLKKRLKELPPKRKLTLKIAASAANAGRRPQHRQEPGEAEGTGQMKSIKTRIGVVLAGAAVAAALCGPSAASAATEFGSYCPSSTGEPGYTFVSVAHGGGSPLPAAAPVSGVITRWTANTSLEVSPEVGGVYAQRLLLFRATGVPNELTLIAQSDPGALSGHTNTYPTRIPVQAGDFLGVAGNLFTLVCATSDPADQLIAIPSAVPLSIGSTSTGGPVAEYQVPIAAAIEPDVDGDGYGDETQDGCPQSAAYHTACPVVVLDGLTQTRRQVRSSSRSRPASAAEVEGDRQRQARQGAGKVEARPRDPAPSTPGKITKVTFKFPAKLKKQLKELAPKQEADGEADRRRRPTSPPVEHRQGRPRS